MSSFELLYFSAPWCKPCETFGPIVDEVTQEYPDLFVTKIDASKDVDIVMMYKVYSIPTLIYLEDDKEVKRHAGAMNQYDLHFWLNS